MLLSIPKGPDGQVAGWPELQPPSPPQGRAAAGTPDPAREGRQACGGDQQAVIRILHPQERIRPGVR